MLTMNEFTDSMIDVIWMSQKDLGTEIQYCL